MAVYCDALRLGSPTRDDDETLKEITEERLVEDGRLFIHLSSGDDENDVTRYPVPDLCHISYEVTQQRLRQFLSRTMLRQKRDCRGLIRKRLVSATSNSNN